MVAIRAEGFYGLHEWDKAMRGYDRLLELRPKSIMAIMGKARCQYYLGHLSDSLGVWNSLLKELTGRFKHGSTELGGDIAVCLANRAGVVSDMGNLIEANLDLSASIDMFNLVLKNGMSLGQSENLAQTLISRAGVRADQGGFEAALKDLETAQDICNTLSKEGYDSTNMLASVLHDRATVLMDQGKNDEALTSLNGSLELHIKGKAIVPPDYLAARYITRAIINTEREEYASAINDSKDAIALLERLEGSRTRQDLATHLATAYRVRGAAYAFQKDYEHAINDMKEGMRIVKPLLAKSESFVVASEVATLSINLGDIYVEAARSRKGDKELLETALTLHNQGVLLFRGVAKKSGKVQGKDQLAVALRSRSLAFYRLGRKEEGRKDLEEVVYLLSSLIKAGGREVLRMRLAECLIALGLLDTEDNKIDKGLRNIDKGIELQRIMVAEGNRSLRGEVAKSLQIRGRVYGNNKQKEKAIKDFDEAIGIFRTMIENEGRKDLQPHLDRTLRHRKEVDEGKPLVDLP